MRHTITAIFAFFLLTVFTVAGQQHHQLPDHNARYLKKNISYTINKDGSWSKEYSKTVKLNTYSSLGRQGETFIKYNPKFQKLKILKSETTMKDGTKVPGPANAFNEVLPRDAAKFPHYSHLREMVVTHTGLERGATIRLHYRIDTKSGFLPYFTTEEIIDERVPVDSCTITVSVPTHQTLHFKTVHIDNKPEIKEEQDKKTYTFTFNQIKARIEEPLDNHFQAYILLSTAKSWKTVFPSIESTGPAPEALVNAAVKLKENTSHIHQYYLKVSDLIAEDIAHCEIPITLNGFSLRNCTDIFNSNYGISLEKTYLFSHLFKQLEIPAEIIAIPHGKHFFQEVPTFLQVDKYYIKISEGNHPAFIDTGHESEHLFPLAHQGDMVFNLSNQTFSKLENNGKNKNQVIISGKVSYCNAKPDGSQWSGTLNLNLGGRFSPFRSIIEKDPVKALKKVIKKILPIKDLKLKTLSNLNAEGVNAEVTVEGNPFTAIDDQRLMLKKLTAPFINEDMVLLQTRQYPLVIDSPADFQIKLSIDVPKDMEVTFLSPTIELQNDYISYTQRVNSLKPGTLQVEMAVSIKKSIITPDQYTAFRDILNKYYTPSPLLIVKKLKK